MHFEDSIARRRQTAKQQDFLHHFSNSGNVFASAKQAGISRQLVYYWRENSPAFAEKLSAAAAEAFKETRAESPQDSLKSNLRGKITKSDRRTP